MSSFEEEIVSNRNEVVRLANRIITEMKETGEKYVIAWGKQESAKLIQAWKDKKNAPKLTVDKLREGIVNATRRKMGLGDVE